MLKFGNKEFRNIQEQVEKNAKDIEELKEVGVDGGLPSDDPTDDGQILIGNTNGSVEWSTETIYEFANKDATEGMLADLGTSIGNLQESLNTTDDDVALLDNRVTALENAGGGGSVSNIIEFDNLSAAPSDPTVVDSATMTKLQDPETVIYYNNELFHYERKVDNTIIYRNIYIVPNKVSGEVGITEYLIKVRTVADGDYAAGVWYAIENALDIPTVLGTKYTDNGNYIWVANKSGEERTGAWQKYTPGSGGTVDNVVEFDTLSISQYSPTTVDEATMEKLTNPGTVIKYDGHVYRYDDIEETAVYTLITYTTQTLLVNESGKGEATLSNRTIGVRSTSTSEALPLGVWQGTTTTLQDIPAYLGSNFTEDGNYIWVANKYGNSKTSAWQKYTPGSGGDADLSNYYTKIESDNKFADKSTINTTIMGINTVLEDIPDTYATKANMATLEASVMGEISGLDTRVDALEGAAAGEGNFVPQGSIAGAGQLLVSNADGTYTWSTQTIQELADGAEEAHTIALAANSTALEAKSDITALSARVTALENIGIAEEGSY